eukprot:8187886-Pyramimonas_sp.AAC.1
MGLLHVFLCIQLKQPKSRRRSTVCLRGAGSQGAGPTRHGHTFLTALASKEVEQGVTATNPSGYQLPG